MRTRTRNTIGTYNDGSFLTAFGDARRKAGACQRRHGHFRGVPRPRERDSAAHRAAPRSRTVASKSPVPRSATRENSRSSAHRDVVRVREFVHSGRRVFLVRESGGPDSSWPRRVDRGRPRLDASCPARRLCVARCGRLRCWRWWRPCCARARGRSRVGLLGGGGVLGGGRE